MSRFDGSTCDPALDADRLETLLGRVLDLTSDGRWRTLREIAKSCGGSEASVSARLRDLRKARFGGYTVERRRVVGANGLWEYRVLTPRRPTGPAVQMVML